MPGLLLLLLVALVLLVALLAAVLAHDVVHPPRRTTAYAVARGLAADPGELGLAFETWTLDRPDGARLPVWEIETGAPARAGAPTVVLVHGWGRSRLDALARLEPWRAACPRAVLYDLRGHGEATGTSRLGCDEDDDLLALLDRLGPGPAVLAGHSMGAVVALHAAARAGELGANAPTIAAVVATGAYAEFHASLRGRLRRGGYPSRPLTDLVMLWLRLRGLRHRDLEADVAAIACPILLVHGRDDEVAPLAHAERLAAAARDATLIAIDGAGHDDAALAGDEAYARAVAALLRRVAP